VSGRTARGRTVGFATALAASLRDQHWMDDALCVEMGLPVDFFFPAKGDTAQSQRARAVCRQCPVTAQCERWAIDTDPGFGVFGNTTAMERRESQRGAA
jgi:WhiB family redox-sensing transcriptional regulator